MCAVCAAAPSWAGDATAPSAAAAAGAAVASVATPSVAGKRTEIDELKDEFAALMKRRAGVVVQARQSMSRINAAKDIKTRNPLARTETAVKYREAAAKVDRAIDESAQYKALKAVYDDLQRQKVELSATNGTANELVLKLEDARNARYKAMIEETKKKSYEAKKAVLDRAGIKDVAGARGRDATPIPDAVEQELRAISLKLTRDLGAIVTAQDKGESTEEETRALAEARKNFEETSARYKDLESAQAEVSNKMKMLRGSLRKTDPAIAALQKEAVEASRAHAIAVESTPEAASARAAIEGSSQVIAEIDRQAAALWRKITAKDPAQKEHIEKLAAAADLVMTSEEWQAAE
jgi:hypothetical protein